MTMNQLISIALLSCLAAVALAGSSSCDIGQTWVQIAGGLSWISSGDAGVWGVHSSGSIFYRVGTYIGQTYYSYPNDGRNYGFSHSDGTAWVNVPGALSQLDVGKDSVWGVYSSGSVYYRTGITASNPTGTGWVQVTGLAATQVSVSDIDGKVWAVTSGGYVYRRVGVSDELPGGVSWEYVPGVLLRNIDVGAAGVWGVSTAGDVYYRTGSRKDCQGSGWELVPQLKLNQVASGGDVVWGVTASGAIYFRLNIISTDATGAEWIQVPGNLKQISTSTATNAVWGVHVSSNIYTRHQ